MGQGRGVGWESMGGQGDPERRAGECEKVG